MMILSRSRGETIVRDVAPATPPARKYDDSRADFEAAVVGDWSGNVEDEVDATDEAILT